MFFNHFKQAKHWEDAKRITKGNIISPSKLDTKGIKKNPKESMPISYATSYMTMEKFFKLYIATDLNISGTHLHAFEDSIRRMRLQ